MIKVKKIIKFKNKDDFKNNFGEIYCINRDLKKEYLNYEFEFLIDLNHANESDFHYLINGFLSLKCNDNFSPRLRNSIKTVVLVANKNQIISYKTYVQESTKSEIFTLEQIFFETDFVLKKVIIYINMENSNKLCNLFAEFFLDDDLILKREFEGWIFFFCIEADSYEYFSNHPIYLQGIILLSKKTNNSVKIAFNNGQMKNKTYRSKFYQICHYLSNFGHNIYSYDKNGDFIKLEIPNIRRIKQVIPAIFIDNEMYNFLKKPISPEDWETLIGTDIINLKDDKNKILQTCQRYLFKEFDNRSIINRKLRNAAYLSSPFADIAQRIPLLAILIFSQFDYFYRNDIQSNFKKLINNNSLQEADFIINLQGKQTYERYEKYEELRRKGEDIKSLIYWEGDIEILSNIDDYFKKTLEKEFKAYNLKYEKSNLSLPINTFRLIYKSLLKIKIAESEVKQTVDELYLNLVKDSVSKSTALPLIKKVLCKITDEIKQENTLTEVKNAIKTLKLHKEISSEIFEATSLAEGILQIIENAVTYASGCLLSIRVYDMREERQVSFLQREYKKYLFMNNKFYLEVLVSDVSSLPFSKTFLKNMQDRSPELFKELHAKYPKVFENLRIKSFFSPSKDEQEMWTKYYENTSNQIHHYGLQIFSSIVMARKGSFVVESYGDIFSEKQEIRNSKEEEYFTKEIKHIFSSVNLKQENRINEIEQYLLELKDKNSASDNNILNGVNFFKGTSYRIFLPLNHILIDDNNVDSNILVDNGDFILDDNILTLQTSYIDSEIEKIENEIKKENCFEVKEKTITKLCDFLKMAPNLNETNFICIVVEKNFEKNLEVIIKTFLLYYLQRFEKGNKSFYLAMTNLSSHQLLESVRLLSLFLNKNKNFFDSKKGNNLQIYLKGQRVGEEIILIGDDIHLSAQYLRRSSMMRGTMSEIVDIAEQLLLPLSEKKEDSYE